MLKRFYITKIGTNITNGLRKSSEQICASELINLVQFNFNIDFNLDLIRYYNYAKNFH